MAMLLASVVNVKGFEKSGDINTGALQIASLVTSEASL